MPIYEYICEECSVQLELKHGFEDKPETNCPSCKGKMRRIYSSIPVIFKGTGFYITESRQNNTNQEEAE
ncbi:FmdB family zinc ribbon protein [Chloroflexota bacterium]